MEVIGLVENVYEANTQRGRVKYGRKLQKSIRDFLEEFLEHMQEEESIFQPLLNENFDSNELKQMKQVVDCQHSIYREKVKSEKSLKALKRKRPTDKSNELDFSIEDLRFKKSYCQEVNDFLTNKKTPQSPRPKNDDATNDCSEVLSKKSKIISEETTETSAKKSKISTEETTENSILVPEQQILFSKSINDLPEEILIFIFSHLNPRSLVACGAANRRWRNLAFSSVFWKALYPTQWARGK